jgi:NADPH2:quinone reductase
VAEPEPGPGEILIDVRAAGVNFPDVLLTYGKYQFKPAPPFIPGGEAAGVVEKVGPNVTAFRPGDRVAATMIYGAFAERIVVPQDAAVTFAERIDYKTAAATLLTYLTTLHALQDRAALRSGETLLVLGAAGGVGVAAIQLGKLLGARVIAAASTDDKVEFCKQQGADLGICYGREDLKERAKALTGGTGVDVIYDPLGGAYSEAALRAIAWEGRHLIIGFAAGEIPKLPANLALLKGCQIVGVFWGQFMMREPQKNRDNAARIFRFIEEGKLSPHIDAALPFASAGDALSRMERRQVRGKLVLTP